MKKIFFERGKSAGRPPFWQPWGCMGCLWRTLVFLIGMLLIAALIAWLRGCDSGKDEADLLNDDYSDLPSDGPVRDDPYTPEEALPSDINDDPIADWNDSIPDVEELPSPDRNFLPPVDSLDIKPSPEDSLVNVVADQIIVLFNSTDVKTDMANFARQFKQAYPDAGYSIIYYNPSAGTMLLQVPEERVQDLLTDIPQHVTGMNYKLTTNPMLYAQGRPDDPGFGESSYQRYFQAIQAFDAWDITLGSEDVIVGVVDTYFCLDNPELNSRYVKPIHIPTKTSNVLPRSVPRPPFRNKKEMEAFGSACHGTHVAAIAIGNHNNGFGTGGIAPQCRWMPISVGDMVPTIYIMEGILYAIYQGADVVNISMGMGFEEDIDKKISVSDQAQLARKTFLHQEDVWDFIYRTACDHNCVICTAAGNENIIMGMDPGNRSPLIVKVEATDGEGNARTDFSNYGVVPSHNVNMSTMSAPGQSIFSGVAYGMGCEMSGTSQASPFVTGAVALMKSLDKSLTPDQIIEILKRTGKPMPAASHVGPFLQIRDALLMVKNGDVPGKLMNYDEVVDNHDNLVGRWKSTVPQELFDTESGKKTGDCDIYMEFTSTTKGLMELKAQDMVKTYTAPLTVAWGSGAINITQTDYAVCTTNPHDKVEKYEYICKPDQNGLMEVTVMSGGREVVTFNMRKIR